MTGQKEKQTRIFEEFESNSIFLCNGRAVTGPDKSYFFLTLVLIIVPEGIFQSIICKYVLEHNVLFGVLSITISIYLFLVSIASLLWTSLSDPGIIPKRKRNPEYDKEFRDEEKYPLTKTIALSSTMKIQVKYCDTCNIMRPPRCTHCSVCNNCCDRFDHHCPWTGNCIGRRNYRFFLCFVYSIMAHTLIAAGVCALALSYMHSDGILFVFRNYIFLFTFGIGIFSIMVFFTVSILGFLHCYLVATNQTTNEHIKDTFKGRKNPYSNGVIKNCLLLLCPPKYPHYIKFHHNITDDSNNTDETTQSM